MDVSVSRSFDGPRQKLFDALVQQLVTTLWLIQADRFDAFVTFCKETRPGEVHHVCTIKRVVGQWLLTYIVISESAPLSICGTKGDTVEIVLTDDFELGFFSMLEEEGTYPSFESIAIRRRWPELSTDIMQEWAKGEAYRRQLATLLIGIRQFRHSHLSGHAKPIVTIIAAIIRFSWKGLLPEEVYELEEITI